LVSKADPNAKRKSTKETVGGAALPVGDKASESTHGTKSLTTGGEQELRGKLGRFQTWAEGERKV